MKRKHSEMIKAWNDNDELSVFVKNGGWSSVSAPSWDDGLEYFVCLEKHEEAVFELLIGGKAEVLIKCDSKPEPYWSNCSLPTSGEWENNWWYMNNNWWYMNNDVESRVKPKKQTRYAYVHKNGYIGDSFGSKDDLASYFGRAVEDERVITFEIEL